MHPTLIEREFGFLGPYPRILSPGQTQQLVFSDTDEGPFWMTQDDRIQNRFNQNDGADPLIVQRNKSELISALHGKGITNTKGKNKKEIVAMCNSNSIPIARE
jgi:hypothetical protein